MLHLSAFCFHQFEGMLLCLTLCITFNHRSTLLNFPRDLQLIPTKRNWAISAFHAIIDILFVTRPSERSIQAANSWVSAQSQNWNPPSSRTLPNRTTEPWPSFQIPKRQTSQKYGFTRAKAYLVQIRSYANNHLDILWAT